MRKVKLASYTENDLQFLHELLSDPETQKYFPLLYTSCIEQSNLRLKTRLIDQAYGHSTHFLIKEIFTKKPVGEISGYRSTDALSTMELAIIIHPAYRGKGFAKLGTIEFMKYAKRHQKDITKFRLKIADTNSASVSVAHKLEFELTKKENNGMQYFEKDAR